MTYLKDTESKLFWHTLHQLIYKEKAQVIMLHKNEKEAWLMKKNQLFRVIQGNVEANFEGKTIRMARQVQLVFNQKIDSVFIVYTGMVKQSTRYAVADEQYTIKLYQCPQDLERLIEEAKLSPPFQESEFSALTDTRMIRQKVLAEVGKQIGIDEEAQKVFSYGKPIWTMIFLTICAIVYIMMEVKGSTLSVLTLIDWGAKFNPAIYEGEWWRFLTPMFLHIGILHILLNMMALYFLGTVVEKIYGSFRFFVIYMTAGIFSIIASFAFSPVISAGASGAIFGLFGALLYFGVFYRELFFKTMGMNVLFLLGINLVFGMIMPMVDNAAHIGGLVGGFLASAIVHLPKKNYQLSYSALSIAMISLLTSSLLWYGFIGTPQKYDPITNAQVAYEYIERDEKEKAYDLLTKTIKENPNSDASVYFLLGYLELDKKQYEKAIPLFRETIVRQRSMHEAHYNLAYAYEKTGQLQLAKESIEDARRLNTKEKKYKKLEKKINEELQQQ